MRINNGEVFSTTRERNMAAKTSAKSSTKATGKRELIAPQRDKRYVRRDGQGQFSESDDRGKSLSADVRQAAKTKVKPGQGDKGDQK